MNRPAKGFSPIINYINRCGPFFVLRAQEQGKPAVMRVLEGPLEPPFEGASGAVATNHGLPRFRNCTFAAAYPLGQVLLSDQTVPLDVRIEAFNPLVPGDADMSGIPVAILRYVLFNRGSAPISATVCGSIVNFIGTDGSSGKPLQNRNTYRASPGLKGIYMDSRGVDRDAEQWGSMALSTSSDGDVSHRTSWANVSWGDALLHFWDELSETGRLTDPDGAPSDLPMASLAASLTVPPESSRDVTFLLTWHFPNRQTWTPVPRDQNGQSGSSDNAGCCGGDEACCAGESDRIGNYYATLYQDAWDVAVEVAGDLDHLEEKTVRFVEAFCQGDLPAPVKEAALFNVSTLRTQTCFRTEDGLFFGFEGCNDKSGCCLGSCTHVWNYEQTTAFLFPDLARKMREVEFAHATDERGHMSFRVHLPLSHARDQGVAAADGQMGCLMKLYRDWQISGDDAFLERLWPHAKRALSFAWIPGGWDSDQDGVMEGCQHNTLDVEYYGPNPLMATWYLGALRACEEMARYMGDTTFANQCRDLFERGSKWVDSHLFNGEYYEHEVRPPSSARFIAEGLINGRHAPPEGDPPHQIGRGCLVDQLAGQFVAHVCGLGYLLDPGHVQAALQSVYRYNFKHSLHDHFNHLRSYALGDEQGLVMCSFPKGGRPKRPTPYFNELMTGFEYTAAIHMLFEGQVEQGLHCIEAIRNRYDGHKRNPFNEAECGHHYARAMVSWAAVLALSGFHWSAVTQTMEFADRIGLQFWSNGEAWGTVTQTQVAQRTSVTLRVLHGRLQLKRLVISGKGEVAFDPAEEVSEGNTVTFEID